MKNLASYFLLFLLVFSLMDSNAQHRCGFVEHQEYLFTKYPHLRKQQQDFNSAISRQIALRKLLKTTTSDDTLVIPVVVHIVGNGSNGQINGYEVTDAQVYSQIDVLNRDFNRLNADTASTSSIFKPIAASINVKFCLASTDPNGNRTTGIQRITTSRSSFGLNDEFALKSNSQWSPESYLNIWVCRLIEPSLGELLGYASFPSQTGLQGLPSSSPNNLDGVVINYRSFGTVGTLYQDYNMGRTTTHEVGHWLGLRHTWGDQIDCSGDDYCDDVPACADQYGEVDCSQPGNICSATKRMIENYMDYSGDVCMNIFTEDQKTRMRTSIDLSPLRMGLRNSFGCCEIVEAGRVPFKEDFFDGDIFAKGWGVTNFDQSVMDSKFWRWDDLDHSGKGVMMIEHDSVFNTSSGFKFRDHLETSYFALAGNTSAVLEFDLAYARNIASGPTESLAIYMSGSCREDAWILVDSLYGDDLVSISQAVSSFRPDKNSDWKTHSYKLNNLPNSSYVRFRFISYSNGVNPIYLDNVNVFQRTSKLELSVMPNPSVDAIRVEVLLPNAADIQYNIFDTVGRLVLTKEVLSTTSYSETLNISTLPVGIYILRIISGDEKVSKKIVVSK
jgi:hypothetical protein